MNFQGPGPNIQAVTSQDLYQILENCGNRVLRVTYCSLTLNNQCVNTKTIRMRVTRIDRRCEIVEGLVIVDDRPSENIILKNSQILNIECVGGGQQPPGPSPSPIFDIIRNCRGFVRITLCTNLQGGQCTDTVRFPFLVTEIDERNNNIKGYRIRGNSYPEYVLLDASLITRVQCLTQGSSPNLPWNLISYLQNSQGGPSGPLNGQDDQDGPWWQGSQGSGLWSPGGQGGPGNRGNLE